MKKQKYLFFVAFIIFIALLSSCNQTETNTCGVCGNDIPIDARYCSKCGTSVATTCGGCGNVVPIDAKYCSKCGLATCLTENTAHVHAWSGWTSTTKVTCTTTGTQERSCSCGAKETKPMPTAPHTEVIDQGVAATCEKEGLTEGKHCAACQIIIVKQETIPMVEHNYVNRVCSVCGCQSGSEGLSYNLSHDGTYYTVSKGTSTDENIIIPNSYKGIPVTGIESHAFFFCTSLTSITIPNSVTSIGYGAFKGCTSLTSITIPDSVTSIGDVAFSGCTNLANITIPDSVTSIGDAFSGCTSLTSITIPDSVTEISGSTFFGCTSLTSITIPDSVTKIGWLAFFGCTNLKDVYYTATEAQWKAITIASSNAPIENATIHYNSKN